MRWLALVIPVLIACTAEAPDEGSWTSAGAPIPAPPFEPTETACRFTLDTSIVLLVDGSGCADHYQPLCHAGDYLAEPVASVCCSWEGDGCEVHSGANSPGGPQPCEQDHVCDY
jgi:hypothetical protein